MPDVSRSAAAFEHDALFYSGTDDFVDRVGAFIREGVQAGEPALVVVDAEKIERLRAHLGDSTDGVRFADMAEVGRNPARIIPEWADFVQEQAPSGRKFRGVGEPIWAARTPDELVECERHEALLNVAFVDSAPWTLVCPYDVTSLAPAVLREAERNHPSLREGAERRSSSSFQGLDEIAKPFERPLPAPPADATPIDFTAESLAPVRASLSEIGRRLGLSEERADDLMLAVSEVITNSVVHGGGGGSVLAWATPQSVVCEVRGPGLIGDPLVGRHRPAGMQVSGFGMWIVTQLCDLVQVRSGAGRTTIRMHLYRA